MFRIAQGLEGGLSRELQCHKHKAKEINPQQLHTVFHQLHIIREDPEPELWHHQHQQPAEHGVDHTDHGIEPDCFPHPIIGLRAVVEADDRLGAAHETAHRQAENFPNGIGDGHHTDKDITAIGLQGGITDHLHQTVGSCHDEVGRSQFADVLCDFPADPDRAGR